MNSTEVRNWLGKVVGGDLDDLSRHDKWLCMMYPRLMLLHQMLRDDGSIFISIDDNEITHLHNIMREIFGAGNFVANIIWQKRTSPDARIHLGPAHDFIVVYAKYLSKLKPTIKRVPPSGERTKAYKNPDNDPRGIWASVDLTGQTGHATADQFFEITTPAGVKMKPPAGRCWALAERTFLELVANNRVWFGKNGKSRPRLKKFLNENDGVTTWTWWPHVEVGHNQEATKELNEIMSQADVFDNPKPTRLIRRILQLASEKDSIILDAFPGSGTTGHAVLQLNKQDGGNRRFILVEIDSNICRNVTAERVRRVCAGYKKPDGTDVEGLGGGFRYATLGEPLFDERGNIRRTVSFADLARHVYFTETGEPLPKQDEKAAWLNQAINWLIRERGFPLEELTYAKFRLRTALEVKIKEAKRQATQKVHQALLADPDQFMADGRCEMVFEQGRYVYDWQYKGFTDLPKHFYPQIGNLRAEGEEFQCAVFLSTQLEGIKYWVRNVERKATSFSLQTGTDRFYPDFVCLLEDGRILVVEYKNSRDWDLPENEEKRQLGALWERRSGGRGLFIMPLGKDWSAIREKIGKYNSGY